MLKKKKQYNIKSNPTINKLKLLFVYESHEVWSKSYPK